MGWFWKKKKKPLFGGSIEPSCSYCQHNSGKQGEVVCALRKAPSPEVYQREGAVPGLL